MTRTSTITRLTIALALGSALAAAPAMAQGKGHGNGKGKGRGGEGVPPGQMPPAGMCRIWIDGVPPGHQPAPTDCATAMRNRPSNARVLFGDDNGRRGDDRYEGRRERDDDRDRDEDRNDDRDSRRRDTGVYSGSGSQPQQQQGAVGPKVWGRRVPASTTTSSTNYSNHAMPMMTAATDYLNGHRGSDMTHWFGVRAVNPRMTDVNRDGRPARVSWFDTQGRLVQVWTDTNGDGRADRVEVYQDGRRVQVVQR